MKRIIGLAFCLAILLPATGIGQNRFLNEQVTIRFKDLSLSQSLELLEQNSEITFTYKDAQLPQKRFDRDFEGVRVRDVISALLEPTLMVWKVRGRMVIIYPAGERQEGQDGDSYTISGYVEDRESGERLIGAQVFDAHSRRGVLTNAHGYFSLELPRDSVKLMASMVGYALYGQKMLLRQDRNCKIRMVSDLELETVIIEEKEGTYGLDGLAGASVVHISTDELGKLPGLMGEADILGTLQMFPGVANTGDAGGGLYVRGGGPDQNLVLLDGVPIYNSAHLFGLSSIFNAASIKSVKLVKGGFPAEYGGRLSSVVDIRLKEGDQENYHMTGNIGLAEVSAMVEGPIIRGKTSFALAARRTILEPYWWAVNRLSLRNQGNTVGYSFYDINGKIQHKISERDRINLSFYNGSDNFSAGYNFLTSGIGDD
ncbi:MAG: carboxypeptidase-like regulatory domain-containing protein, partial [Bacteroidota bacterium]